MKARIFTTGKDNVNAILHEIEKIKENMRNGLRDVWSKPFSVGQIIFIS